MTRRGTLASFLLLLIVLSASPTLAQEPAASPPEIPTFATVNGSAVTRDDFLSTLKVYWGSDALRMLIDERLVAQEAARLGITASDTDIGVALLREQNEYPSTRAYTAGLQERGISENAVRRELRTRVLLDKIVDRRAEISDEVVSAHYAANTDEFSTPARVDLWVITTDAIATAYLAAERLANEDFATVAEELSTDEFADDGGHWGNLTAAEITPEAIQVAAFNLEPDGRSEPIEVDGAFYVIWAKDKTPGVVIAEAEAAKQIRDRLRAEKGVSRDSVLRSLRGAANVSIVVPGYAHVAAGLKQTTERRVVLDGQVLELPAPPVVRTRLVVPAQALALALGASYEHHANGAVQIIRDDIDVVFGVEVPAARVNGVTINLDQPCVSINGLVYVPARWLVDTLGGSVNWVPAENTLYVKSVKVAPAPTPQPMRTPTPSDILDTREAQLRANLIEMRNAIALYREQGGDFPASLSDIMRTERPAQGGNGVDIGDGWNGPYCTTPNGQIPSNAVTGGNTEGDDWIYVPTTGALRAKAGAAGDGTDYSSW